VPGNANAIENSSTEAIARSFFIRLSLIYGIFFWSGSSMLEAWWVLAARGAPAATRNH